MVSWLQLPEPEFWLDQGEPWAAKLSTQWTDLRTVRMADDGWTVSMAQSVIPLFLAR